MLASARNPVVQKGTVADLSLESRSSCVLKRKTCQSAKICEIQSKQKQSMSLESVAQSVRYWMFCQSKGF